MFRPSSSFRLAPVVFETQWQPPLGKPALISSMIQNPFQCSCNPLDTDYYRISQPLKSLLSSPLLSPCPATPKALASRDLRLFPSVFPQPRAWHRGGTQMFLGGRKGRGRSGEIPYIDLIYRIKWKTLRHSNFSSLPALIVRIYLK